jgi:peptide/nickel transport system substrate-binding protein
MLYPQKWVWATAVVILGAALLGGCVQGTPGDVNPPQIITETVEVEIIQRQTVEVTRVVTETVVLVVTPTPGSAPQKDLVVCLTTEPESLYPYAAPSGAALAGAAVAVRHALFDSLITNLTYDYQPTNALVKLPSLADGDAVIYPITVAAGERVADADGNVVVLQNGVRVRNAEGEIVSFDGSPLTMSQLAVTFQLQPLFFSDGTAVTADDSRYSFELNADPDTPADKFKVNRTASYRALDDLTLEWVGLPGFLDPTYFTNIWTPLPRHLWGTLTAVELLEADISARAPVGHGPFVVTNWLPGDRIELAANQFYYQPGYPKLENLTFRFTPNANQLIAKLLAGQCDVGIGLEMEQAPILLEAERAGVLTAYFAPNASFEHIDFNIDPLDGRTRWFTDGRTRRAFAHCTDRAAMAESLLYGRADPMHAYIPASHPLYDAARLTEWPYDPATGNALLDEVWLCSGGRRPAPPSRNRRAVPRHPGNERR